MLVTRLPTFRKRGPDRRPSKPAPHRRSTSGRLFAKRARVCARRQGPAIVPDTSPRRVGVAAGHPASRWILSLRLAGPVSSLRMSSAIQTETSAAHLAKQRHPKAPTARRLTPGPSHDPSSHHQLSEAMGAVAQNPCDCSLVRAETCARRFCSYPSMAPNYILQADHHSEPHLRRMLPEGAHASTSPSANWNTGGRGSRCTLKLDRDRVVSHW